MADILKAVGKKVRAIRKGQGLSQEALGEKSGLTGNYIGLIERGERQLTLTLTKIAEALGIELSAFFDDYKIAGKKAPSEIEISYLIEFLRSLDLQDIKAFRKMAEHFSKRLS